MSKPCILQLVPAMEQGGVERGVVEMNRALVKAGYDNVVVSVGGRLNEQIVADGGRIVYCDIKSKNPFTFFTRAWALKRILKRERPSVVVAHSRVPAWLFNWVNQPLQIPWITFAHGANSISWYSRIMTAGDLTVTPSRYIADYVKRAYGLTDDKVRIIPRAIERERFDVSTLDNTFIDAKRAEWKLADHFIVMGLGRITQLKGYDVLIRAMKHLDKRFKLVIVGEAETLRQDVSQSLHTLVKDLVLTERVVFAGNQQKVAECLSLADVVVSSNIAKPEAFGRSMAEALAMNKPVVATAFGGALEIVEEGIDGYLVKDLRGQADDPAPLFADAIRKVSQTTFTDLRKRALERFSFDKMVASALSVYEETMQLGKHECPLK